MSGLGEDYVVWIMFLRHVSVALNEIKTSEFNLVLQFHCPYLCLSFFLFFFSFSIDSCEGILKTTMVSFVSLLIVQQISDRRSSYFDTITRLTHFYWY